MGVSNTFPLFLYLDNNLIGLIVIMKRKMKDKLAFIRLAFIPLFIFTLFYNKPFFSIITFSFFAALTILSLFFKRFLDLKGKISEFIEPISDKLMVCFAFLFLFLKLGFPKWIVYIVISREILVVLGWFVFYNIFPNGVFGKEKGILGLGSFLFQIITILFYLLYGMNQTTYFFTIVMLTFTITSLVDYIINV